MLDKTKSYLTEEAVEWLDGFLLGDGCLFPQPKNGCAQASINSSEPDWARYGLSGLSAYLPHEPTIRHNTNRKTGKVTESWQVATWGHPDLMRQYERWYPNRKRVPADVRITKTSLLLWYLGDGSLDRERYASITIPEADFPSLDVRANIMPKLKERFDLEPTFHGSGNGCRLYFGSQTGRFFDAIGAESPVKCYAYKFGVRPSVRWPSASDVARTLKISRSRVSQVVAEYKIPVVRDGSLMLFPPEAMVKLEEFKNTVYRPRVDGLEGSDAMTICEVQKQLKVHYRRLYPAMEKLGMQRGRRFSKEDVASLEAVLR